MDERQRPEADKGILDALTLGAALTCSEVRHELLDASSPGVNVGLFWMNSGPTTEG